MQPNQAHSREVLADYERLRTTSGSLELSGESLYVLSGEDVGSWLHGQVTQDILKLQPGEWTEFCLCLPTGQIQLVGRCYRFGQDYLVSFPTGGEPDFESRLALTVIMEDVVASRVDGLRCISVQGEGLSPSSMQQIPSGWILPAPRLSSHGYDVWSDQAVDLPFRVSAPAWEIMRIEQGTPISGLDYGPKTLPPELGPAFESATVSYNKGCYTGQEVLMRIHSRGHTNRSWVGLKCSKPVQAGSAVSHTSRDDAGQVTSAVISPRFGPIATATLRNESAIPGEMVIVHSEDQRVEAEVVQLPFVWDAS